MPDPEEPSGGSDFDRMSLNTLKRELEVQKAKTEVAREEARDRIREQEATTRRAPWALIVLIATGGVALLAGVFWLSRDYLVRSGFELPAFVLPDLPDSGTWEPPAVVVPRRPDAGSASDAPVRPVRRRRDAGRAQRELDFGSTTDPIDGLDDLDDRPSKKRR